MAYSSQTVTVDTTKPWPIAVVSAPGGILVQNSGDDVVFVGGDTIESNGTNGIQLNVGDVMELPTVGGAPMTLYAIAGDTSSTVSVLFATGG